MSRTKLLQVSSIAVVNPLTFYMDYSGDQANFLASNSSVLPVRLGWFLNVICQRQNSSMKVAIYELPSVETFSERRIEQSQGHHICFQLSHQDDIDAAVSLASKAELNVTNYAERATYIVCNPISGRLVERNMRTLECFVSEKLCLVAKTTPFKSIQKHLNYVLQKHSTWVNEGKPHTPCPETHIPIFVPNHAQSMSGGDNFLLFVGEERERLSKLIRLLSGT